MQFTEFQKLNREQRDTAIRENQAKTQEIVRDSLNRPVGFTYQTLGGFYRAYCYVTGSGYGPIDTRENATKWVFHSLQLAINYDRKRRSSVK